MTILLLGDLTGRSRVALRMLTGELENGADFQHAQSGQGGDCGYDRLSARGAGNVGGARPLV